MKNLKTFYLSLFAISAVLSCSESNDLIEETQLNKNAETITMFSEQEQKFILANANLDMISFVDGISEFYEEGDSYEDLKSKLDPMNALEDMHPAANKLLYKAYTHLSSNELPTKLNGLELMQVFKIMLLNAEQRGVENLGEMDLELESLEIWGSSVQNLAKKKCKWWQLGCHVSNAWAWLGGSSNGNGGQTNGQVLRDTVATIAAVVGLIILLSGDND